MAVPPELYRISTDTTINMESTPFAEKEYRSSIFLHHNLQPDNAAGQTKTGIPGDWIVAILLSGFILLAWNHVFNPGRFLQVLRAAFSRRYVNQLIREGNLFTERIAITMIILYLITISLLLYLINHRITGIRPEMVAGWMLYLFILAGLAIYIFAKVFLIIVLGKIFKTKEATYHYLLNMLIIAALTAPLMLFLLVLLVYIPKNALFFITLALLAVVMIIRFVRGFLIGSEFTKFSHLLLFVYLCSLEILPLLVLIKTVMIYANPAVL